MGRMQAARCGVTGPEHFSKHAGMRRRAEFVENGIGRCDSEPRHGGHEQRAVAEIVDQCLDDPLSAESLVTEPLDRAVHHQHRVAWHLAPAKDSMEDRGFFGG